MFEHLISRERQHHPDPLRPQPPWVLSPLTHFDSRFVTHHSRRLEGISQHSLALHSYELHTNKKTFCSMKWMIEGRVYSGLTLTVVFRSLTPKVALRGKSTIFWKFRSFFVSRRITWSSLDTLLIRSILFSSYNPFSHSRLQLTKSPKSITWVKPTGGN